MINIFNVQHLDYLAKIITSSGILIAFLVSVYKWFIRQKKQDEEIERIKKENAILCFALSACLDGLIQLGANHSVPVAKDKLDKYLNEKAHL